MTNQAPNPLPVTLPAGTRSIYGHESKSPLELRADRGYPAYWAAWLDVGVQTWVAPKEVDWSSVTPTKPAEAPKLCDACGEPSSPAHYNDDHRSAWSNRVDWEKALSTANLCKGCATGERGNGKQVGEAILARRSLSPSAGCGERPLQAGDWVECVNADGAAYLRIGARYLVAAASYALIIEADDGDQYAYDRARFKRVDGPHPTEDMAPPTSPLPPRPLSPSAPTGTCLGCGADFGYAHRPGCTWNTKGQTETHCPECPTALTTETVGRAPFCRVCTERRASVTPVTLIGKCESCPAPAQYANARFCVYCGDRGRNDLRTLNDEECELRNEAARKRIAAMAQAERPSGNRAERAELRKPHPWSNTDD